jgi:hypothetical protein
MEMSLGIDFGLFFIEISSLSLCFMLSEELLIQLLGEDFNVLLINLFLLINLLIQQLLDFRQTLF